MSWITCREPHPSHNMDTADNIVVINDPETQEPLFSVGVAVLYRRDFKENADKLKEHVLIAIQKAVDDAMVKPN